MNRDNGARIEALKKHMESVKELRPCPFCGEIPQVTSEMRLSSLEFNKNYPNNGRGLYLEKLTYSVECICCSQSKAYDSEEQAITAWNRREGSL